MVKELSRIFCPHAFGAYVKYYFIYICFFIFYAYSFKDL